MIKTIKTRLILTVSVIVLLSIACVSAIVYQQNIKKIENLLGQKVESIAKTSATLINGDMHQKVVENLQGANDMPEWKEIQQALSRVKKENGLQEDVYTMMDVYWVPADKDNPHGQVMFTAMATSETFQPKGQKKEKYVHESMTEKKAGYTDIFQTMNGFFITGYAPILTSKGAVTAVVEVALEVGKEIRQARMNLIKGILIAAMIALLIAIFLTVFSAQKISSPIKKLTGVVQKMSGGDLEARVEGIQTNDEIQILGEGFNEMAINLERSYKELENYSKNLEKMVAERTAELAAANRKITAILNNMKLGVFVVDENLKIQPPASAYCKTIFNQDVVDTDVMDTLFGSIPHDDQVRANIESANIAIYGEDDLQWGLMENEYPTELTSKNKETGEDQYLEIKYSPLWDEDGNLSELLYVVDDVTELKKLQKEAEKARQESEITNRILTQLSNIELTSLEGHFSNFRQLIDSVIRNITNWENINKIYMDLHTIKGNSRVLGLTIVAATIHQIESEFGKHKNNDLISEDDKRDFLKAIDEAVLTLGRYNGLGEKIFKIKNFFKFPDTNKYFHFMVDFLSKGETTKSVIEELHNSIPDSIPETCISIVDDVKNVNWVSVLNIHLNNLISFEAFNKLPLTVNSLQNIVNLNKTIKEESYIIKDIQGMSYFTESIKDLNNWTSELKKDVSNDLDLLLSFIIAIDFVIKSSEKDYETLIKTASKNSSVFEIMQYMATTPGTLLFLAQALDKKEILDYMKKDCLSLDLFQKIFTFSKADIWEKIEDVKVLWNENNKVVEFDNSKLDELLDLNQFSFSSNNQNSIYRSMGTILLRGLITQLNNPLTFYTPDDVVAVKITSFKRLEMWFESNVVNGKDIDVLSNIERYPLAEYIMTYAPNIERKAIELGKLVRLIVADGSVNLSKDEFKMVEDAMVHLLTNSLVHGIEKVDTRIGNQKSSYGKIVVGAYRDSKGALIITVKDDGSGLNFDLMKEAIKNSESASDLYKDTLTDKEIFDVFLEHSISTKEEDDLLSGKGVGLSTLGDLVNKGIAKVDFETELGKGTTFSINFS